jgi:hypothetical protein
MVACKEALVREEGWFALVIVVNHVHPLAQPPLPVQPLQYLEIVVVVLILLLAKA